MNVSLWTSAASTTARGVDILFFFLMGVFRLLPLDTASRLGGWMGRTIFSRLPPDRIARANLKAAFPEKSQAEIETILSGMWDNLDGERIQ